MSSQPTLSAEPQRSPKDVPQLTDPYRKVHKLYVLFAGLLASWELIGVTLDTKDRWGIELKSPKAVPLILLTLMLYSGYKTIIEWLQCGAERNKVARLDYWVAHSIALVAIVISVVQYLTKIQIVDLLSRPFHLPEQRVFLEQILFLGIIISVSVTVGGVRAWRNFGRLKRIIAALSIPFSIYLILAVLGAVEGNRRYWMALSATAVGAMLPLLSRFLTSGTHAAN